MHFLRVVIVWFLFLTTCLTASFSKEVLAGTEIKGDTLTLVTVTQQQVNTTQPVSPPDSALILKWLRTAEMRLESHFNVSLVAIDSYKDSVHKPQCLKREEGLSEIKPRSFSLPTKHLMARPNKLTCSLYQ